MRAEISAHTITQTGTAHAYCNRRFTMPCVFAVHAWYTIRYTRQSLPNIQHRSGCRLSDQTSVHWRRFYFQLTRVHCTLELFERCALQIYLLTYLLTNQPTYTMCPEKRDQNVFFALHGMPARTSDEKGVCLSVRLSNAWIVTKRKKDLSRFLYHAKDHLA